MYNISATVIYAGVERQNNSYFCGGKGRRLLVTNIFFIYTLPMI